ICGSTKRRTSTMLGPYPLKPIITNDPALARLYDDHPDSLTLTSGCLTPAQASSLLEQGAIFDTVVLLNGQGTELLERLVLEEAFKARRLGGRTLYTSEGLEQLERIEQLKDAEYGQAVQVDRESRAVSFGRDFLGHYPLSYAVAKGRLYVSDNIHRICGALQA